MKTRTWFSVVVLVSAAIMAGCGSGGDGGAGEIKSTDTTPPKVIYTIPAGNSPDVPLNSSVSVTFSEAMDPSSITPATFLVSDSSGAKNGTVEYDSGGRIAVFKPATPFAPDTRCTVTIGTGVTDIAGNHMAVSYTWGFATGTTRDGISPTGVAAVPADGANGVSLNGAVTVLFSEAVDPSTVNGGTFTISQGGTAVTGSVEVVGTTATLKPLSNLQPNTTYTGTINGVADLAGNTMAGPFSLSWTTGSTKDSTSPHVVSVHPVDGTSNIGVDTVISVTFSESMYPFLFGTIDGVPAVISYDPEIRTFTLTPAQVLKSGTKYFVNIRGADLAGNVMKTTYKWSFTTR